MATAIEISVRVADAVFIGAALLQRENPDREDFSLREIEARVVQEGIWKGEVGSISAHISRHCVANSAPNGGSYAVLFETRKSMRRLLLPGDPIHPDRQKGKKWPEKHAIPAQYRFLVDWAVERFETAIPSQKSGWLDGLLSAQGIGSCLSSDVHPDEHVRQLREGWN